MLIGCSRPLTLMIKSVILLLILAVVGCTQPRISDGPLMRSPDGQTWVGYIANAQAPLCSGSHIFVIRMDRDGDIELSLVPLRGAGETRQVPAKAEVIIN